MLDGLETGLELFVEILGRFTVLNDDGFGDLTVIDDMDNIDTPVVIVLIPDKLDTLDKHRVVRDGASILGDSNGFHLFID